MQTRYTIHTFNLIWSFQNVKVTTGALNLDDLPNLDKMVENFNSISTDGPNKILRGIKQAILSEFSFQHKYFSRGHLVDAI